MNENKLSPDDRFKEARAKKAELQVEEAQKKLLKSDFVTRLFKMNNTLIRNRLIDIPNALAGHLTDQSDPGVIFKIVNEEINSALSHVAEAVRANAKETISFNSENHAEISNEKLDEFYKQQAKELAKKIIKIKDEQNLTTILLGLLRTGI